MSIEAADLKKLVKIIRQYEVIYGGGISTGDAAVREECESLVVHLESELRNAPRGAKGNRAALSLPSLIEAKNPRRGEKPVRPLRSRATELAGLVVASPSPRSPRQEEPAPSAAKRIQPAAARGRAAKPAPKGKKTPDSAKTAKTAETAKSAEAKLRGVKKPESGLASDLRSAHTGAAKAAAERARKLVQEGRSDDDASAGEGKRRFAAQHLFDAFRQNKLPKYGGFILCVRFSEESGYTVIEIIGYENLQDIYPDGETLIFKSVGCKLYAIVEPPSFLLKSVEPVNRPSDQMVPYRFSELLQITTKRFQNVYVGRKPVFMPTSFSVVRPGGDDLAILFYDIADVYNNIQDFLIMMLRDRMSVPVSDSRKVAEIVARGIREFRLWLDEA